jgi:hypothetical protein
MTTTLIIVVIVVALGGLIFFRPKASNSTSSLGKTTYMSIEEAKNIVQSLDDLGYYKYAAPSDLEILKKDLTSSLAEHGGLSTIDSGQRPYVPLDYRLFFLDGETLFEQDGFTDAIERMQPLFDKMDFKIEITNHVEEVGADNWLNHSMTINGKPYIIFENFEGYGWGEAAQRFAEIINDQLALQGKNEKIYLINGGNDGATIYLTGEQFNLLDEALKDQYWKPLKVDDWCKTFDVDPRKYMKNSGQQ